ncbi:hypothetical protein Aperf_G00000025161 [Anoplocephala perfoliata]
METTATSTDSFLEEFIPRFMKVWQRMQSWDVLGTVFLVILSVIMMRMVLVRGKIRRHLRRKRKLLDEARVRLRERVEADPPNPELSQASAIEIQDQLQRNDITPLQALRVYQKRLLDVLHCNGVCDIIEEAEDVAKSISPNLTSPIRGMPVSIKENISIAGYDCCIGLISRALNPQQKDSPLVKVLRNVGAVPFVTTTMSPTGLCLDASTDIFGKQRNPYDSKRLVGGSSSGEALLISKGASPLGFGTDIAGSIRFPAALCGICAIKPTSFRLSTTGVISVSRKGCIALRPVFGPMSRHVSLLADSLRALLTTSMFDLDPRIPPIMFREEIFAGKAPLTIGFYDNIGGDIAAKTVPSVVNALSEAKEILKGRGHKLVEFHLPNPDTVVRLAMTSLLADGGKNIRYVAQHEMANARFRKTRFLLGIPAVIRRMFGRMVQSFFSKSLGCSILASTGYQSSEEVFTALMEVSDYQKEFAEAWADAKIDVLLCPALPFPAPLESTPDIMIVSAITFSSIYNLVDYPAGIVPVRKVSESDVEAAMRCVAMYKKSSDFVNARHAELQSGTQGLPLVVQVVGKPLNEESVLRVMREIEEGVKRI